MSFGLIRSDLETAEFSPWLGIHPEDVLNDQTVKHGFIDRFFVPQNETNTARQSIYGLLKHRSGLQTLSVLFASVVEQRQTHSSISSGSAFKPPPRVTLTEGKRKTWLCDLANPAVPLRKLNRTIPQGIRGQPLLEQCFANNVPIGRALWFAKCVGANEIRTLKRKGASATFAAGAEVKWLRDWTINIEQFSECSIGQCRQEDWRQRMNYAFSLTLRLYSESLLDRDHYLGWIVKSLSSTDLEPSPAWLLLVQLHKADLSKYRNRGRPLVESLLEKLCTAIECGHTLVAPYVARLTQMLRSILHANPASFIMPQSWKKYRPFVEMCLDLNRASDLVVLEQLSYRNERLSADVGNDCSEPSTPRRLIIHILDGAELPFSTEEIALNCRSACEDVGLIVKVILEWCSSRFRAGKFRVYLAVRLLQIYQKDINITSAVIDFFASQQDHTSCDVSCLRLLVFELIRSQLISLSRYLQWLTARGGIWHKPPKRSTSFISEEDVSEDLTDFQPVQFLTAVPLSCLSPAVRNLRGILLERAGFSVDHEATQIESVKSYVALRIPTVCDPAAESHVIPTVPHLTALSWSIKSEISLFLKQKTAKLSSRNRGSDSRSAGQSVPFAAITDVEFRQIRMICEDLEDLSILVEIIKLCVVSDDEELLASLADTICFHLDAFSAIGALADLHSRLIQAYQSMRANHRLPRQFIFSLISLATIVSSSGVSLSSLQQDMARGDRSLAIAACSPVSDGMAESLQQAGPAFTEEFEAVLSTGNRMEQQTMAQLFKLLAERLDKGHHQNQAESDKILCGLYARLRIYRIAQFDSLIDAWLQRLVNTADSRLKQLLPLLISTGCVSFQTCVEILVGAVHATKEVTDGDSSAQRHLASFLDTIHVAQSSLDPVSYKLKLENARHIRETPHRALELRTCTPVGDEGNRLLLSTDFLARLVLKGTLSHVLPHPGLAETITLVLDNLLQLPEAGPNLKIPELIQKAHDLSMPFCSFRLKMWAAVPSFSSSTAGPEDIAETLINLAKSEPHNAWIYYSTTVGLEAAGRVREKAEEAFFALPAFTAPARDCSTLSSTTNRLEQASRYMTIVAGTSSSIPPAGVQTIVPLLVERFASVLRAIIAENTSSNSDNTKQAIDQATLPSYEANVAEIGQLTTYLTLLLRMTFIHRSAFASSRPESLASPVVSPKQSPHEVVKILMLLTNIALHPSLHFEPQMVCYIFDVALTIVDDVSDEIRALCAKILKDKIRDQRAEYLFGSANNSKGTISGHGSLDTVGTTTGILAVKDGKTLEDYRSRNWEMLEGGTEVSISLSLFDARREV